MVTELKIYDGAVAIVLDMNNEWHNEKNPLLTLKFADDTIGQLPASWCLLCQRK